MRILISTVKAKNIYVDDDVDDFLKSKNIEILKFIIHIVDEPVIIALYNDNNSFSKSSKSLSKVYRTSKSTYIRTPYILRKFVGEEIMVYQENESFRKEFEAFRIKPIGFSLLKSNVNKRRIKNIDPYITKSGQMILTKEYIDKKKIKNMNELRLSFSRTDVNLINKGYIFFTMIDHYERGGSSYPMYKRVNKFRTHTLRRLQKFLSTCGKDLSNFFYLKTVRDKNYNEDVIVFKEIKNYE